MANENVLEMRHITKDFSGVVVLEDVDFSLRKGEVHALVGANGAGKSTLVKILNGIWLNYAGEVLLDEEKVFFKNPVDAAKKGIGMIHQELDLTPNLTVAQNIYLGRELCTRQGLLDKHRMEREAQKLLDELQFGINAREPVANLPTAKQQLVLIARTVSMNSRLIIMDEPTSSLSIAEIDNLFRVVCDLKARGISIIYISHFLEEIFRIADRVTVLRDGKLVKCCKVKEVDIKKVVAMMVGDGKGHDKKFHRPEPNAEKVLEVENMCQTNGLVHDISLSIRKGEVVGLAGVLGSGRTEVGKMIFGALKKKPGCRIALWGKEVDINNPQTAVANKMAFISENRKTEGLILKATLANNIYLVPLVRQKGLWVHHKALNKLATDMGKSMSLKYTSMQQDAQSLSGGNQQKVVLSKWLAMDIDLLILDQPTRGIDVGAKGEIFELVDQLAKRGTAILYISDELEELYNICDRILVMKRGEIIAEMDNYQREITKGMLFSRMITDSVEEVVDL